MIQFNYVICTDGKLPARYVIEDGKLSVEFRGETMSVTAGVNEMANAFLRDNLMSSMLGEIERAPPGGHPGAAPLSPDAS